MNSYPRPVIIPLLNPNEPEARLASLGVEEGQHVSKGQILCTLETTKAVVDLTAEAEAFVVGLRFEKGQLVPAGEILCYLADSPDWAPAVSETPTAAGETHSPANKATSRDRAGLPAGLRITQPALTLARQAGLDLDELPIGLLITKNLVKKLMASPSTQTTPASTQGEFDPTALIVYGGGGHGISLIDLVRALRSYRIVGIVDDGLNKTLEGGLSNTIMGLQVLGGSEVLPGLYAQGVRLAVNAVGGIGDVRVRVEVFQRLLDAGFACPAVVHPSAVVEPSAVISPGAQVFPHAYVGSQARIGFGVIVNTGAIVSHDCVLDDYVNLSPGAILAGGVQVGKQALIGMGVTINLAVKIGEAARVGNGATVKADVPASSIVQAGTIWPS